MAELSVSASTSGSPSPTELRGGRLRLARAAWVVIAAVSLALLIALIPINWRTVRFDWEIQNALPAVQPYLPPWTFARYILVLRYLSLFTFLATAALIFWRRSNDWMALLVSATLAAVPVAFNLGGYSETWSYYRLPWRELLRQSREALTSLVAIPGLIAVFFLFPNGRVVPRWLGRAAWVLGGLVGAGILMPALSAWLRLDWPLAADWDWTFFFLSSIAAMLAGLFGQVYRYRNVSGPTERQQIKPVVLSLGLFVGGFLFVALFSLLVDVTRYQAWLAVLNLHWQLITLTLIPVSIAVSVLRYRLWNIDLLINRAAVYGGLTALIVAAYVVGVGLAGRVLQAQESAAVAVLALVVIAPLIPPLRRRLQRAADRLLPPMAGELQPGPAVEPAPEPSTRLRGARLIAARAAWGLLAGGALAIFIALAPSADTIQNEWLFGQSLPAVAGWLAPGLYARYILSLRIVVALIALATAGLITWRKSDDWLALLVALFCATIPLSLTGDERWRAYPAPWGGILENAVSLAAVGLLLVTIVVAYRFPDGAYAPRWMRWPAWAGGLLLIAAPILLYGLGESYYWPWIATFFVTVTVAVGGQVYRYRRVSDAVQRQQTKWVVGALALLPIWLAAVFAGWFALEPHHFPAVAVAIMHLQLTVFAAVPLAFTFSILRYRLWDIDLLLNRTLAYGALTAAVVGVYVVTVGVLGALFQAAGNVALSVLATGLIAILFNPARQRMQAAVNRLMYGERDDPATVLARLGQRLEAALRPESVLPTVVESVARALKSPYAAIEVNGDQSTVIRREWRDPAQPGRTDPHSLLAVPLTFQSESLGRLLIAPRAPGEAFTPADRRLLETLARQAAPAVHALRLTADLQQSRERLVTAREEERRRIRRDLHDGLGPTLAGQTLKLDAALDLLEADPAGARRLLHELKAQTQATVADIRRLVYELRPPALDELGLVGAVRAHIQNHAAVGDGLHVTFDAPSDLPALPAAVEVAAHRIVLEALTNVVRHARASECSIRLAVLPWRDRGVLNIEVTDDGVGLLAKNRSGVGLASMRERAEELGGVCLISNGQSRGARVLAQLPINPKSENSDFK